MIENFLSFFRKNCAVNIKSAPDVVLHIGAPKTGTSAIQRFCMNNRQALLKKGYYYPEHHLDINNVSGGHGCIAGALMHGNIEDTRKNLKKYIAKARKQSACLLLSAEAFYAHYHEALYEMMEGLNVKIICFVRNPVEYLLANHNQGIKRHFSTQRLNDLIPKLIPQPSPHLCGKPLIRWADAFGDENCIFKSYQAPDAGGDVIEVQFLRALGWPDADVQALTQDIAGMTNRSYVRSALELKRLLNTVLGSLPDQVAKKVDWCLQGYSDKALDQRGYSVADLSPSVRALLEDNLLSQMQPVIDRFPHLQDVMRISGAINQVSETSPVDLHAPLAVLKSNSPEVFDEVYRQAVIEREKGRQDYAFCKLLDLLDIDFHEPKGPAHLPGLSPHQRDIMQNPNTQVADCLREMAVLLESHGLVKDAQFTIDQALARRPNGPGIQAIKARIDQTLELK